VENLYVVGRGGAGRETMQWCLDFIRAGAPFRIAGFIDDNVDETGSPYPCFGPIRSFAPSENDLVVCSVGDPATRARIVQTLTEIGWRFATIVHPTARVGERCSIGPGSVLGPNVVLTCDARVGAHCLLNAGVLISHDCRVGDFCTLAGGVSFGGGVQVGEGVLIGLNATILPRLTIGQESVIGAGAVVTKDVSPSMVAVGVPAQSRSRG